jgi:hypothetical protein
MIHRAARRAVTTTRIGCTAMTTQYATMPTRAQSAAMATGALHVTTGISL